MDLAVKQCGTCDEIKPLTDFHKGSGYYNRQKHCKICAHAKIAEDRKNPKARAKWDLYLWRSNLNSRYGINEIEYLKILADQNNGCAICGALTAADSFQRRLHVDHNHITGIVRGLLCGNCNNGLGRFKDDLTFLKKAIAYLEKYDDKKV